MCMFESVGSALGASGGGGGGREKDGLKARHHRSNIWNFVPFATLINEAHTILQKLGLL